MFFDLAVMIDGRIYHDLPYPSFEGGDGISICRLVLMYFFKNFQKSIIKNFHCVIVVPRIAITYRHSIPVERTVDRFLTIPVVLYTTFNRFTEFPGC